MTIQNMILCQNGAGAQASLQYDDATMMAQGFNVHVPVGSAEITFTAVVNGVTITRTYVTAYDDFIALDPQQQITVTTNRKGLTAFIMPWLESYGMTTASFNISRAN